MRNTSNLGRFLANSSFWSLAGQIVSTAATLIFFAVLTRTLSPSDIGTFMLLMNVVMLASLAGMFGVELTMVRSISSDLGAKKPGAVAVTVLSGNTVVLFLSLLVGIALVSPAGAAMFVHIFDIAARVGSPLIHPVQAVLKSNPSLLGIDQPSSTVRRGTLGVDLD